jgi:hypothetical protein
MKNSKTGMGGGAALVAGIVVAAAVLSGCTSSGQSSASGGASSGASGTSGGAATASVGTGATTGATSGAAPASTGASTGTQPTTDASTGTSTAAGISACTDADLKVSTTSAGAGLGHVGWILVFTNTGSVSCSVEGYPGAGVTDKPGGVVLNATRQRTGYLGGQYPGPATIVLKPGGAASTMLEWIDAPPNGQTPVGANCPGMDGGKVLVTPPNTRQSTPFPAPADLCSAFEVHPLIAGTSGRAAQ